MAGRQALERWSNINGYYKWMLVWLTCWVQKAFLLLMHFAFEFSWGNAYLLSSFSYLWWNILLLLKFMVLDIRKLLTFYVNYSRFFPRPDSLGSKKWVLNLSSHDHRWLILSGIIYMEIVYEEFLVREVHKRNLIS